MKFKSVCVVGLGYIGLPTAAMFASKGISVIGVDTNQVVVDTINRGEIHIIEPDLDKLVSVAVSDGMLRAAVAAEPADAFMIAVPTPFLEGSSDVPEPDLTFIRSAVCSIAPLLKRGDLVILESTSPVGTTDLITEWLSGLRRDLEFPKHSNGSVDVNVAHCPERVLPGSVVRELVENDRIIGGVSNECSLRAKELYKTFVNGECIITNARTAEMAKLTENSCRDVQIAFANELSMICDEQDINVWELIALANRHPRINILNPGPGVGGHCIAVDPWFIVSRAPEKAKLIKAARLVNDSKPSWVVEKVDQKIAEFTQGGIELPELRFWGLAFKADIDDLRESPALKIVEEFCGRYQGVITVVEPNITELPKSIKGLVTLRSEEDAKNGQTIDVILVDHKEFKALKFNNSVIDTRGVTENQL